VSPESPRDAALDQDAQEQDAEAPESGLEDAGTDAASDASSPPEEASCNTIGRDVRFNNDVILPFASDRDGLLLTATIVSAFERGRGELYASEPYLHQVSVLRGCDPYCEISVLSAGLVAPLRATPVDFDGDGDRDVLVADIGLVQARVDLVGRVVLLVNEGSAGYRARVLLDGVGRVACAEPADLDNDGDIDVSVCEFGAKDGSLSWLERTASGGFQRHILRSEAGTIHAYPFDADADGDLDLGVALSQKAQQVLLYRNQGGGQFSEEVLYQAANERFGLSGIELDDLDRDGDTDILVAAGDYQDDTSDLTQHGLYFLRNDGSGRFAAAQRLSNAPGVQTVKAIDLDDDCDTDLVLGSLIVPAMLPPELASAPDLIWLENDGMLSFEPHTISGAPKQLTSLAAIHVAGSASLFAGSFSIAPAAAGQERLTRLRVY
jgi:hypothetical protein